MMRKLVNLSGPSDGARKFTASRILCTGQVSAPGCMEKPFELFHTYTLSTTKNSS
jgi:hypothetical protein